MSLGRSISAHRNPEQHQATKYHEGFTACFFLVDLRDLVVNFSG